jgi:nicotinic acid phosphoribosyltransferase
MTPALLTDLYQLTMTQAYWRESLLEPAVFSFSVRRLPRTGSAPSASRAERVDPNPDPAGGEIRA